MSELLAAFRHLMDWHHKWVLPEFRVILIFKDEVAANSVGRLLGRESNDLRRGGSGPENVREGHIYGIHFGIESESARENEMARHRVAALEEAEAIVRAAIKPKRRPAIAKAEAYIRAKV